MNKKQKKVLHPSQALQIYSTLIEFICFCHQQMLLLRVLNPNQIRIKNNQICFYNFTQSIIMKKKRKIFQNINSQFIAPQYISEDGYSSQVDIWASGVLLYYMLTATYPFSVQGKTNQEIKSIFDAKISKKFSFIDSISKLGSKFNYLKQNSHFQDLFSSIFTYKQSQRISLQSLGQHPLLKIYFNKKPSLVSIWQSQHDQSIFYSQLSFKNKWVNLLHKQEAIIDFIVKSSQNLILQSSKLFQQQLKYKVHSAILKMALIKCNNLIDVLYGKIKPYFEIDMSEWQDFRKSSIAEQVRKKMQKKFKLLHSSFKAARLQFNSNNILFDDNIPSQFNDIKSLYRTELSAMYRLGRVQLKKLDKNLRQQRRRLIQGLVRIIIYI